MDQPGSRAIAISASCAAEHGSAIRAESVPRSASRARRSRGWTSPASEWRGRFSQFDGRRKSVRLSASLVDQLAHCFEIGGEGFASGGGDARARQRLPRKEALLDLDVARVLELAQVEREIALRRLQRVLEFGEIGDLGIDE